MIQRIQTLYLFLIIVFSALLFFFPFQINIIGLSEIKYIQLHLPDAINTYIFIAFIVNAIIIVGTIATILLYQNRKRQMVLCHYLSIINVLLFLLMYIGAHQVKGMPIYKLPFIIPVLNAVLAQIARWYIKKDEELVKSADRIR